METGDGWLVRLHPPGARLTPAGLRRVAVLAAEHGNGLVEISARANLQIRGVTPESHPILVERLLAEGLLHEHEGGGPQRLTLVSPLAGPSAGGATALPPPACGGEGRGGGQCRRASHSKIEPRLSALPPQPSPPQAGGAREPFIDAAALSETIETHGRNTFGLPPKISVIVDDGGSCSLDALACDLRLVGIAKGVVALGLADRRWHGPLAESEAAAAAGSILRGFAKLRRTAPDSLRRLHDLADDALAALTDLPGIAAPPLRPAPRRAGLFTMVDDRFAVLIGLPFGRCDTATLDRLAEAAAPESDIRFSPWRGPAFRGLDRAQAERLLTLAQDLGLIVSDDDPRLSVQACAGSPACSRAEASAMADAARLAEAAADLLAQGVNLHASGCVKACAHPSAADLTLVGRAGRYDVIVGGTTRDKPLATLDLPVLLARLQPGQDIHARLSQAVRKTGPRG
ncbi:hypothetical protein ACWKW2_11370 [Bosea thiooxidans]